MHEFTTHRMRVALGSIAIGTIIALTACAPSPEATPTASPSPATSPSPEPYAGPIVFVGDELAHLLLTPEEIIGLLPEATEVGDPSSVLEQISDGGGLPADPSICEAFYAEQSLGSVGARTVEWQVPTDPDHGFGRLLVLQFADEAHAEARMDQLVQAATECASFTKEAPATFDAFIPEDSDGVRAFAGTLLDTGSSYDWRAFEAFASVGNVIVQLWQPFTGERTFDAESAALLLQARAGAARTALIEELTANPPAEEEDPSGDPGAVWSEWQIGVGGVGPLRLGADIDDVLGAVDPAQVVGPTYDDGPVRVVNAEGSGSILVQAVEDGTAVGMITVGNDRSVDETPQDGSALPSRRGIRIGDPVAAAIESFPGGTIVDVSSSGDDFYDVTNRDGRVFRFRSDRDVVEDGATIVGVTLIDGAAEKAVNFG